MNKALHTLREVGRDLSENCASVAILLGVATTALYIPGNSERQASYDNRQRTAMNLADTNHDGILSNDEVPNFYKYGGRIFIR